MVILIDTGPLLALFDPTDGHRARVVAALPRLRSAVLVPQPVIGELGYFLSVRMNSRREASALRQLGQGMFALEPADSVDFTRAADLVEQYGDFPIGTVDALIVAMAERLGVTTIFTLDRRHFAAIQPAHCERFEIVP